MLDLLSFLIFLFQANLLRRCEDGGGDCVRPEP
jgi:hypothetical protein